MFLHYLITDNKKGLIIEIIYKIAISLKPNLYRVFVKRANNNTEQIIAISFSHTSIAYRQTKNYYCHFAHTHRSN